ncbi:polysaccharide biosynthesis protein [Bacteroides thetaiotaomicron]|uniref:polysaccharide biosynthesis protein n=1 Tax=Bacteroides thetaiotaomicron TaxID=818 RepID=UPI001C0343AC|nr:polysaccharide biosynthesis protein [Bacteroides thetaiotaomicron]MBT9898735.1 polysaccharide biosynthesis protein [Bacteroides thetaiotaomicron]MCS2955463.1 polysaccharide biosynthesis protein [Bacteroides thetaiotaomicron]
MSEISSNNRRIAKNTLLLYIRMFFTMAVSLYTSRVVLDVLGVEDFGIYNVIGGVIAMFTFLNISMSGATSRFLTYELGTGNQEKLKATFNSAVWIHRAIALIIIIVAETLGLWFFKTQLVIPDERMEAAMWIFQFSVISMAISVTQVPYNACIIAHEKMDVYAYVEIINVILKLLIVYLLTVINFDKLILYAFLLLFVTATVTYIYRIYCLRHFVECQYTKGCKWQSDIMKPMLSFSGWDLYGNMSTIARTQGVNILLNIFFGPVLNAASGVANQVQAAVMGFAGSIVTAVKPQIIKSYAAGELQRMERLVFTASKLTFILLLLLSLPLMVEMNFILSMWLKVVPEYAVSFCICTLLFNFFATMSAVVVTVAHAIGKIKRPSVINGTLYLLVIPVSYLAFRNGLSPISSYIFNVLAVVLGMLSNVWTVHKYIPAFSFKRYFLTVFIRCLFVLLLNLTLLLWLKNNLVEEGFLRLVLLIMTSIISVCLNGFYILFDYSTRLTIIQYVKNYAKRFG